MILMFFATFIMSTNKYVAEDSDICHDIAEGYIIYYDNEYGFGGNVDLALDMYFEIVNDCNNNWGL